MRFVHTCFINTGFYNSCDEVVSQSFRIIDMPLWDILGQSALGPDCCKNTVYLGSQFIEF